MDLWLLLTLLVALPAATALAWYACVPVRLRVGRRGIHDRKLRLGWIRWDEIEGAYQPNAADVQSLRLKLRRARRSFEVRLDLADSDVTPIQLLQEIVSRNPRALPH